MAEKYRFMDAVQDEFGVYDREYNAQEFTDYFKALVTTGVMKGAGNQLAVSANGSSMITKVDTGIAFILGRYYENDSFKELTHDTETLGNSRIDRIVVRMDLATEARYVKSFIKKGVPSTNPVPPTLTQTANYYEISLAQVKIVGGQTFIATNAVTDERGTDIICPWAGSNILPNFNAEGLQELIDSQLVDGENAKAFTGDLNILIKSGFYFVDGAVSTTANKPINSNTIQWLVTVIKSPNGDVLQDAQYINNTINYDYSIFHYRRAKISGVWTNWQVSPEALSDSLNDPSTTKAATANAVKQLNDLKANKIQMSYVTATLQNGWTGYLRYYKDEMGIVHILGQVNGTSSSSITIFTLPTGYRPDDSVSTATSADLGSSKFIGQVVVTTSGAVMYNETNKPLALNINCSFRAIF